MRRGSAVRSVRLIAAVSATVAAAVLGACSAEAEVPEPTPGEVLVLDSSESAALMRAGGMLIIDARPHEDYLAERPVGMQNIPISDTEMWESRIPSLDSSQPVAVYCDTAACSAAAADALSDAGFDSVYDMGGIEDWDPDHLSIDGPT